MNKITTVSKKRHRHTEIDETGLIWGLGIIKLAIFIIAGGHYYYNPEEFYLIACTNHISWGFVDIAPLSVMLLWLSNQIIGLSLYAIHLLPAISGALSVVMIGFIIREIGGGRFAITLGCTAFILTPFFLTIHNTYSPAAFDSLFYILVAYFLVKAFHTENKLYWVPLGLFLGMAILNTYGNIALVVGVFTGLLLKQYRKLYWHKEVWYAGVIIACAILPHIFWQYEHQLPFLQILHKHAFWSSPENSVSLFIKNQFVYNNPFVLPILIAGLLGPVIVKSLRKYYILQFMFITVLLYHLILGINDGKTLFAAYPLLIIPGTIVIEKMLVEKFGNFYKPIVLFPVIISGLYLLPLSSPVLPIGGLKEYIQEIFPKSAGIGNYYSKTLLQHYNDQFDTKTIVEFLEHYISNYNSNDKKCIITDNSRLASSIEFNRAKKQLPPVISPHNLYGLVGPGEYSISEYIYVDTKAIPVHWRALFKTVTHVDTITVKSLLLSNSRLFITECSDIIKPIENAWPALIRID